MAKKKTKKKQPNKGPKKPVEGDKKEDPQHTRFTGAGVALMFLALGFSTLWSTADNDALKLLLDAYFNFFNNSCEEWREKDANIAAKHNKGNPKPCQCFKHLGVQPHQPWCLNLSIPEDHPALNGCTKAPDALFEKGYNQPPMPPPDQYDFRAEQCRAIGRGLRPVYAEDFVASANACLEEHHNLKGTTCRVHHPNSAAGANSTSSSMENACLGYGTTTNMSKYCTVIRRANAEIHLIPQEMRHIDVGCGSQPNVPLMVLFECGCLLSDGIEFDPVRAYSAHSMLVWFIGKLQNHARAALRKLAEIVEKRVHIYLADLDFCTPAFWNIYTHVFSYDKVFHGDLMTKLARKVHNSESIVFVTTFAPGATNNVKSFSYTYFNSFWNPRPVSGFTDYTRKFEGYYGQQIVNGAVYKWAPSPPDHDDATQGAVMDPYQTSADEPKDVVYLKQLEEEGILEDPVRQAMGIMMLELPVKAAGVHKLEFTITDDKHTIKHPKLLIHLVNYTHHVNIANRLPPQEERHHSNKFTAASDQQHMDTDAVDGGGDRSNVASQEARLIILIR